MCHGSGREAPAAFVARWPLRLSGRNWQTLHRLLRGESEKEIAAACGISVNTVHSYVKRLFTAFGVNTRAELMARFVPDVPPRLLPGLVWCARLDQGRAKPTVWTRGLASSALAETESAGSKGLPGDVGRAAGRRAGTAPAAVGPRRPRDPRARHRARG